MHPLYLQLALILVFTSCLTLASFAPPETRDYFDQSRGLNVLVVADEILVKFKPGLAAADIAKANRERRGPNCRRVTGMLEQFGSIKTGR